MLLARQAGKKDFEAKKHLQTPLAMLAVKNQQDRNQQKISVF